MPKRTPSIVTVPKMNFIAVRGSGDPNDEEGEYKQAIGLLYGIAFNTPRVIDDRWVNRENEWVEYYEITPDDYEGYVFVPVDIQITRAEGTLHIVNK